MVTKQLIASLLLVTAYISAPAASRNICGRVIDKISQEEIPFATVKLLQEVDSAMVTADVTDSIGCYKFNDVPPGNYFIEVSYIGYIPSCSSAFNFSGNESKDMGTIELAEDSQVLDEVVVEGRKPTLINRIDRKIYNVGQDISATTGSLADVLQNVPSLDVDIDGAVSLRGNENVMILINGKPSAMMESKNRGDLINQIPANNIERIEVITNPSAEFKPDGMNGIINIILKENKSRGIDGTVNAGTGSSGRYSAGFNLNAGWERINIFSSYQYRRDRYDRTIVDKRETKDAFISQNTYGLGRPISHMFQLGTNVTLTDNDLLSMSGSYTRRRFQRNENMSSTTTYRQNLPQSSYERIRDALAYENIWNANASYSHTFGMGRDFGVSYNYSSESEDEMNRYNTVMDGTDTKNNEGVWDANYIHLAKADLRFHFNDVFRLVGGYEMEHRTSEQNYNVTDWNGSDFVQDTERSNDFTSKLWLNSFYSTLEMNFGKWNLLAGLRGEFSSLRNYLFRDNSIVGQSNFNVYPTFHAGYALRQNSELKISYSRRVNRPDGSDMNPFPERINPLSLQAGNPYLKPENIQSVELGWLWHPGNITLSSTLYYRYISNEITEVSKPLENDVLFTTKENLNSSQNAGMELIFDYPVVKWLNFNVNLNGFYNEIDASRLGFGRRKGTFAWSSLANINITPIRHLTVQLNTRYRSSTLVPQGRRNADFRMNMGVRYEIPAINLACTATVTDLFDSYKKEFTLDTSDLKQNVLKRRNPRIIYVGLVWQFGIKSHKKSNAEIEYDEGL